ncbi:hypothetical protein HYN59_08325 [Flavobacterium album]|uniref:Glycosyltransferase n=1 Tax=Flavobacterium album TaxID=2175091 RepID=A0A2S1QXH8_9FLAO|nr:glycosyltransferase family 4 protein [Flavobacterium album]AWH85127.1 hypothetical protein HYN59_08325 [Flavobacterium album]
MNILFLISNDGGNGVGGHYNSLNQVSIEMAREHNVKIVTLGSSSSPVILSNPNFAKHIKVGKGLKSLFTLNAELKSFVKTFTPDVVHCFDTHSLNRILPISALSKYPVVLNKCGGRNPLQGNYQHADAIVVFSKENQEWFIKNKNYDNKDIFIIPNRVRKLDFLDESQRVEQKDPNKITFVRVSRLGGAYEKTLLDSYNLIEELAKRYPVEFIVIGRIQNKTRFEALTKEAVDRKLPVKFITDERAAKGSDFLYLADFVVGTGRSFMEATSLGIPSLTPVENANYPMLVNKENFDELFSTNFSERNKAETKHVDKNLSNIEELIQDKAKYEAAKKDTLDLFTEFFGTGGIVTKYNAVYDYALKKPVKRFSLIRKNLIYIVKFALGK